MQTLLPVDAGWTIQREGEVVFVCRDGGAEPAAADWRERMAVALGELPVVGVAARRLDSDGAIFSMGDFLVHPKGFHQLARGVAAEAFRFPEEIDGHVGGLLAVGAEAFARCGGDAWLDHAVSGQLELCLALRRDGGRIVTLPDVSITDEAAFAPSPAEREAFAGRWGFDPLAPDLDDVRARHGGTGLLWNTRFHGRPLPFEKYDRRGAMHWDAYRDVAPYRQRADHLVSVLRQVTPAGRVLDVGCGDGLFTHLLATGGLAAVGIDPEPAAILEAEAAVGRRDYPAAPPRFVAGRGETLPFEDHAFAGVLLLDVIEHLPNPVPVLRECRRVLAPGGHLVISTPAWQMGAWSDPVYHAAEYTPRELTDQVTAATGMAIQATGQIGGLYRDIVVVAAR